MLRYCYLPCIFLFVFSTNLFANIFLVTTNADTGSGSLREAITLAAANGNSGNDSIFFNIIDISRDGRTIILLTALPELSSNLIIDGTSQAGLPIGRSDAKIILLKNTIDPGEFDFLKFEYADNIQVYGLFLFHDKYTLFNNTNTTLIGIKFKGSTNIVIGRAGKGNYFRGLNTALYSFDDINNQYNYNNGNNLRIQANIFNNDESGNPNSLYNGGLINPLENAIWIYNISNITIGGANTLDGNTFYARNILIGSSVSVGNGYINFINNKCNTKVDGTSETPGAGGGGNGGGQINISINANYKQNYLKGDYKITLNNNIIDGQVNLNELNTYFTIQGNKIFTNAMYAYWYQLINKIKILECSGGGIIGGENSGQSNDIYTFSPGTEDLPLYSNSYPYGSIYVSASPKVAIIKNTTHCTSLYGSTIQVRFSDAPTIQIDSTGINFVKGKATPNCKIDVFLDDDCKACDGILFLGRTTANADSSWSFSGLFSSTVIATAAKADGTTSGYTEPIASLDKLIITQPTCGLKNGSFKGIYGLVSTNNVEWHQLRINTAGTLKDSIVSVKVDAENLEPGSYYFLAKLGKNCQSGMYLITLTDNTPKVNVTSTTIVQPSCGIANGSILNATVSGFDSATLKWENGAGVLFPASIPNRNDNIIYVQANLLAEGKYRLIATDTKNGCADTSAFLMLTNKSGPTLNMNNVVITNTVCHKNNGSIKGIAANNVTGIPFIAWLDTLNKIVGNQLELTNIISGKYRLIYKDQTGCDTIKTDYFEIMDEGFININDMFIKIVPAACTINNGSITNLSATNANRFSWINVDNNNISGDGLALTGATAGNYQLTATNSIGCMAVSSIIKVPSALFAEISVLSVTTSSTSCGLNNGQISIAEFSISPDFYRFKWIDSISNQTLGAALSLSALAPGTYFLWATDFNGCIKKIYSKQLKADPIPFINTSAAIITNDECSIKKGSITSVVIENPGYSVIYNWVNKNDVTIGGSINLTNVESGLYKLKISNTMGCKVESSWLTVKNIDNILPAPKYNAVVIARNTMALLAVNNYKAGNYFLYADAAGLRLLQQNTTGVFSTGINIEDTYYYIGYSNGSCKSNTTEVLVTVVDKSYFALPKSFTPNSDNVNDLLHIRVFGYIKLNYFNVYNRFGNLVFATQNINTPWDGNYKGNLLPIGTYIWIAEGKDITGKIITDKGTIVLLR